MKDLFTKALAVIGFCAVLYVFAVFVGPVNVPDVARASVADAPKYEYKILRAQTLPLAEAERFLNKLGKEGWRAENAIFNQNRVNTMSTPQHLLLYREAR